MLRFHILGAILCCIYSILYQQTWITITILAALGIWLIITYGRGRKSSVFHVREIDINRENPFKKLQSVNSEQELDPKVIQAVNAAVTSMCTYDAADTTSLYNFSTISQNTHCLFAKKAKLWGPPEWNNELSFEANISQIAPTFMKFTMLCIPLALDGFVIEIPGHYGQDVQAFGRAVTHTLCILSACDPNGSDCMSGIYNDKTTKCMDEINSSTTTKQRRKQVAHRCEINDTGSKKSKEIRTDNYLEKCENADTTAETITFNDLKLSFTEKDNDTIYSRCGLFAHQRTKDKFSGYSIPIDNSRWVFKFQSETFFITTFAPCYPENHARYGFESSYAYILFQPEVSFARHDIPRDTEETNWTNPVTVRDRIRIAFRDAGRGYKSYAPGRPMIYDIVKPVQNGLDYFKWWELS